MNWKVAFTRVLAGASLLVAACGSSGTSAYGPASSPSTVRSTGVASPPAGTPEPSATTTATVALRDTPLGRILVDGKGRTLYLFAADGAAMSSCYGGCATAWPPLLATGSPIAGSGVSQSLLGTSRRNDGSLEVVYNGHPLYYFISDRQPGDVTGQAISSFGADWYVVSPAGNRVA